MVARVAEKTDLQASMLVGSVARETADEHSDIDLINCYDEIPSQALFDEVLREAGASRIGNISAPNDDGFVVRYQVDGVELQTGAELIEGLERRLQQIADGDVDWVRAKVAIGVLEALPLHGEALIREWQERARYPESLRRREVEANLGWFPIWTADGHLSARDAELFRRQMLLEGAFRVLAVLSAVNRLYFTSFQFKRSAEHAEQMKSKPEGLAERLDQVANEPPSLAAEVLRKLVEDTNAIVRREMPDVDVEVPWRPDLRTGD